MDAKIILVVCFIFLTIMSSLFLFPHLEKKYDTNYEGLVRLGLAPSTQSRQPTALDLDTGVRIKYEDDVLALYSSRNFKTKDYGKTFVIKIN